MLIVNEATLPADRLAEALAAKAILVPAERDRLLQQAMKLAPKDPRYAYWLAEDKVTSSNGKPDYSLAKPLLEQSLKADPSFLPAKYALAVMQPTPEQRITELQKLAEADKANAEPCLLMTLEKVTQLTAGKQMSEASEFTAIDIPASDLQPVTELLEKFCASPEFTWRQCAAPSTKDIKVSTNGAAWPAKAAESNVQVLLQMWPTTLGNSRYDNDPLKSSAAIRQLARQFGWSAQLAAKAGDSASALRLTKAVRQFAGKYACCKPYDVTRYLVAAAVRSIAADGEAKVLEADGNKAAVKALDDEAAKWMEATNACKTIVDKESVTVSAVAISEKDKLQYQDKRLEQTEMQKALSKLGLIK